MTIAWINFRAQPHKRPEVLSAVDDMVERMRTMTGCIRGRLYADSDDPNSFAVVSEWDSADHTDAFLQSRDFQLLRGMRIILRDEPSVVLDDVRARVTRLLR